MCIIFKDHLQTFAKVGTEKATGYDPGRCRGADKEGRSIMEKNIKKCTSLVLVAAMAASLAACGGGGGGTSGGPGGGAGEAADGKVTLRFSWWGGDSRHEATEKAIAAFEAKYPDIHVEPEYGAWSGWEEKQSMNIIGGNAADVLQVNWNWIESYSQGGKNFADLHQYEDVLDLTQFPEDSLAQCEVDGKLMAVPVAITGRLFYWNKTTFDEVGVDLPTQITNQRKSNGIEFCNKS